MSALVAISGAVMVVLSPVDRRVLVTSCLVLVFGACSNGDAREQTVDGCPAGSAGCPCPADGPCAAGLACEDSLCVSASVAADAGPSDVVVIDAFGPDTPPAPEDVAPDVGPSCAEVPAPSGCTCLGNADCASGYCVPSRDGGAICSENCESTCPDGLACAFVTLPSADPAYICVEPAINLCRPCDDDSACQQDALFGASGARCVRYGEAAGSFCGLACRTDAECPTDYACREVEAVETGGLARQCVLADPEATCACSGRSVAASAWTACDIGGCEGTRVCRPDGLSPCLDRDGALCEPPSLVDVTFDPRGGVTPTPASRAYTVSEPYGDLPQSSRVGYGFSGWWTEPDGAGEVATVDTVVTRSAPYTLYASWNGNRYTVSFDAEGGTPCSALEVRFGAPYGSLGSLCAPTRPGHTFAGWFLGDDGSGEPVSGDTLVTTPNSHTLHARWTPARVAVGFDPEGGSPCDAITVTFGAAYGPLCTPTRAGFAFEGWFDGDNGTGQIVTAASVVTNPGNHVLHARWTPATFAVTFEAGEGTAPTPPGKTVTFGALYGALATSERAGHTLGGWRSGPDGTGLEVTPQTEVTRPEDHTLFALWLPNRYLVSFDSRGGSACDPRSVTFGAPYGQAGALCTPTRSGFAFAGWSTAAEDEGAAAITGQSLVATAADHTLYARWSASAFTVTFDPAGGSTCDSLSVTFRQPYGPLCVPTRAGHTFGGWYDGDGPTATRVTATSVVVVAGHHTLQARWTVNSYAVSFDSAGGSACDPMGVTFGAPYGPLCAPARTGHTFGGWWTGLASGTRTLPTTLVTVDGDHTLHARWTPNTWPLNLDSQGGSACEPTTVTWGAPYPPLCQPTRTGYTFAGWWTGVDSGSPIFATTVVATDSAHTVVARWTPDSYGLTFESAGGSACEARTVTFASPYGALCAPTRVGYAFAGWWTGADGGGELVTAATPVATAREHTLYARWTLRDFAVTFDSMGGAACPALTVTLGAAYGALCTPLRAGFVFEGWWTAAGSGTRVLGTTTVETASDHTLYARWRWEFATIPAGTYTRGSPTSEVGRDDIETQHTVTLTRSFRLGLTEVTQGHWRSLSGGVNPSTFGACGDACPVESVSWWSTQGFLNAWSEAEGLAPCYLIPTTQSDGSPCTGTWQAGTLDCGARSTGFTAASLPACEGYRLPTEAEWEYAARAGTTTATYGGNLSGVSGCVTLSGAGAFGAGTALADLGWYGCNSGGATRPVGGKAANAWGLRDMLGNVTEWTHDRYGTYPATSVTDPVGPSSGFSRVARGGSWENNPWYLRAALRAAGSPELRVGRVGLRAARTAP